MDTASTRGILPGCFLEHCERAGSVRKSSIGSNYLVLAIYKVQGIINRFQCYPFQLIWGHCVVIDTLIHLISIVQCSYMGHKMVFDVVCYRILLPLCQPINSYFPVH